MWENIAGAKRYSRLCGFNIAGASAPAVPTPLFSTPERHALARFRAFQPQRHCLVLASVALATSCRNSEALAVAVVALGNGDLRTIRTAPELRPCATAAA